MIEVGMPSRFWSKNVFGVWNRWWKFLLTKNWKLDQVFGTSITESIQIALLDGCKSSQKLDCIRLRQVKIKRCKHIHFTAQYIIGIICTITKISKIINGWSKNILLVWCPGWMDHLVRSGFGPLRKNLLTDIFLRILPQWKALLLQLSEYPVLEPVFRIDQSIGPKAQLPNRMFHWSLNILVSI